MRDEETLVRTSITLPRSLKKRMEEVDVNWSAVFRDFVRKRLERESETDLVKAILINERLRRKAPEGWDSARVIREWRRRRSS